MTTASVSLSKVVSVFTQVAKAQKARGHATTVERHLGLDMFSASRFVQMEGGIFLPTEDPSSGLRIAVVHLPVVPAQPSESMPVISTVPAESLVAVSVTSGETYHELANPITIETVARGCFGDHHIALYDGRSDTAELRVPSLGDGALLMRCLHPKMTDPLLPTTLLLAAGLWLTEPKRNTTDSQRKALREGNRAREGGSEKNAGTRLQEAAYAYGETSPLAAAVCHWRSAQWLLTTPQPYGKLAQLAHELQLARSGMISAPDASFARKLHATAEKVRWLLTRDEDV